MMRQMSRYMRHFVLFLVFMISGVVSWTPALSQTNSAANSRNAKPAQMTKETILVLLRTILLAVDNANKTGNYTVLRDLGANGFKANSAAQLSEIFASQRKQGLDLGFAAILEPQFTLAPQIDLNGLLHMAGFYRIGPQQHQLRDAICSRGQSLETLQCFNHDAGVATGAAATTIYALNK